MPSPLWKSPPTRLRGLASAALLMALGSAALWPQAASAIPLFNRQTGQNCVACHAGGQFPELTPYGRLFKLTGYTLGQRTVPLSAMLLASYSKVANTSKSDDPGSDFRKNQSLILATASLFLGGKVTDNIGAFAQITYDPYVLGDDASYHGHTSADNIDLRYADRFNDAGRDLIFGISLNNNPSLADPWNTAPAWMQYVPVPSPASSRFIDGNAPYPGYAAGGNLAGVTAYAYWNRMLYGELGLYRTSRGALSLLSAGVPDAEKTRLQGSNPYWRLALNHEWGAHSLMVGTAAMVARIYDSADTTDPALLHRVRDWSVDTQYQYLLDPHAVTAQLVYARRHESFPAALANQTVSFVDAAGNALAPTNASDTTNVLRARLSYVYQARYGGSVAFFNLSGTTDSALQSAGFDPATLTITSSDPAAQALSERVGGNLSGNPATRGMSYELFWTPWQYLRLGAQYTAYSRFNGTSHNYDGFGRNARDNNTLFIYAWGAY